MNYDNFETLKNYAINYYLRYYPSKNRLKEKLLKKSSEDNCIEVINSMSSIIDDRILIKVKIENYIKKGKNLNYIKSKLIEKKFLKEDIENILENDFHKSDSSLLKKENIEKKINNYLEKGKSINYIKSKLIERDLDKNLVNTVIERLEISDNEKTNLEKEFGKLKGKYERNKIIEKLLRKGFKYGDIKEIVS